MSPRTGLTRAQLPRPLSLGSGEGPGGPPDHPVQQVIRVDEVWTRVLELVPVRKPVAAEHGGGKHPIQKAHESEQDNEAEGIPPESLDGHMAPNSGPVTEATCSALRSLLPG
jgi:hypothetical protein